MEHLRKLARSPLDRKYETIALTTGFSLMAYELAASRILAPSIGSSTYVWTSVIGIIIAALSAGYAVGGLLADRRAERTDISWLLLAAALSVAYTLVLSNGVLGLVSDSLSDPRLQGMAASTLLFLPASFVLGVISPYLVRLRNVALDTTGRAVASLSAFNAIGGILGTFCVGFVFFSYIGARQVLLVVVVLLVLASWLIAPRQGWRLRLASSAGMLLLALLTLFAPNPSSIVADINTPASRYRVVDIRNHENRPVRVLVTGPRGGQSGVYLDGSQELAFSYLRQIADVIQQQPRKDSILILGGGAYTLPQYLAHNYPASRIDVVEIDPWLEDIAKKYFNYQAPTNIHSYGEDARAFLNRNNKQYDVVVVDVYNEMSTPFTLASTQYAELLQKSLKPGGVVAANIIGSASPSCAPFLGSVHSTYLSAFQNFRYFPQEDPSLQMLQNIIVVYANHPLNNLPNPPKQQPAMPTGQLLTDNYAPVERLYQGCQNR